MSSRAFRSANGEAEYIPKRPSSQLGNALHIGKLRLGPPLAVGQDDHFDADRMTEHFYAFLLAW